MPHHHKSTYIPPLGYHWLTPFYDVIAQVTARDGTIKQKLIDNLDLASGPTILDIGCGTGTLALKICRKGPGICMIGIDRDSGALRKAAWKADQAGTGINLVQGDSRRLPFADESIDQVVSTLFFHHLNREAKTATLKEVYRVLEPGGRFLVADWGKAENLLLRLLFLPVQLVDGFAVTRDNINGHLPQLFAENGFQNIILIRTFPTIFGSISLWMSGKGMNPLPI